jgi:single-stranded-DNA-specific exonuclease
VRWTLSSFDESQASRLAAEARLSPVLARLLVARGIADAESAHRFLSPSLEHLHSPYGIAGMTAAVDRLLGAIERRETVLIYGDYDVDGTTAIVILKVAIELCGGVVDFHVPHRIRDGYGMKGDVIERAAAAGVRLIISVDTGIRAFAAAEAARRAGVDLIVTDHHLPGAAGVPPALAVLNPNQAGCSYPCKDLCGAAVAFKLAQAVLEKCGRGRLLPSFFKMVALATIADAVPLTGENRVFAKLGMEGLRTPVNAGLKALLEVAALGAKPLTASDVAFRLAPRLNAAGRMDVAQTVIELFTVKQPERAREIAVQLDTLNSVRQQEEQRIMNEIHAQLEADSPAREAYCIVVDGEGWHRGVVGIAATRVVERYCRPALVISRDGLEAHGSGRSLGSFHLLNALESCSQVFTRYGGHAHAVGFGLPSERIPELRAAVDEYARARLRPEDMVPVLELDAELSFEQVTPELFAAIRKLEPFGAGNREPVFMARNVRLLVPPRILKEKHVKLRLGQVVAGPNGATRIRRPFDALGWRMAERLQSASVLAGDTLDVAFTLTNNDHPDFGGLELCLEDFKPLTSRAK